MPFSQNYFLSRYIEPGIMILSSLANSKLFAIVSPGGKIDPIFQQKKTHIEKLDLENTTETSTVRSDFAMNLQWYIYWMYLETKLISELDQTSGE